MHRYPNTYSVSKSVFQKYLNNVGMPQFAELLNLEQHALTTEWLPHDKIHLFHLHPEVSLGLPQCHSKPLSKPGKITTTPNYTHRTKLALAQHLFHFHPFYLSNFWRPRG